MMQGEQRGQCESSVLVTVAEQSEQGSGFLDQPALQQTEASSCCAFVGAHITPPDAVSVSSDGHHLPVPIDPNPLHHAPIHHNDAPLHLHNHPLPAHGPCLGDPLPVEGGLAPLRGLSCGRQGEHSGLADDLQLPQLSPVPSRRSYLRGDSEHVSEELRASWSRAQAVGASVIVEEEDDDAVHRRFSPRSPAAVVGILSSDCDSPLRLSREELGMLGRSTTPVQERADACFELLGRKIAQRSCSANRSTDAVSQPSLREDVIPDEEHLPPPLVQQVRGFADGGHGGRSRSRSGSMQSGAGGQRRCSSDTKVPSHSRVGSDAGQQQQQRRKAITSHTTEATCYKAAESRRLRRQQATLRSLGVPCP